MDTFVSDIKYNCDVSDARYWGYFTICGLLLRYLDLYRSERGLRPHEEIHREDIAKWIEDKEAHWPELESRPYRDIEIDGKKYPPFDSEGINSALENRGLVYGAGYGMYMKATFFLAELKNVSIVEGHKVFVAGREVVRDLLTSPAMLQGNTIYIRIEPLKAILWDRFLSARGKGCDAMCDALDEFGISRMDTPAYAEQKIADMAEKYTMVLLRHELAEAHEGVPEWRDLLSITKDRGMELYLRGIKDIIADTSGHGPLAWIVEQEDRGLLSLFMAIGEGPRTYLFPEMKTAYASFMKNGHWAEIESARTAGYNRLIGMREEIRKSFVNRKDDDDFILKLREAVVSAERYSGGKAAAVYDTQ